MKRTAAPKRADAERNIAAILAAGQELLGENPAASMTDIAKAAGVGRVTLYAHFPSRGELVQALIDRAFAETEPVIAAAVADDAPADEALARLIRSSWQILDRHRRLRGAATAEFGTDWVKARHDKTFGGLDALLERGQEEGVLRTDLPAFWMISVAYSLLHTAADEVNEGRLTTAEAPETVLATLLPALRPHTR